MQSSDYVGLTENINYTGCLLPKAMEVVGFSLSNWWILDMIPCRSLRVLKVSLLVQREKSPSR